MVPVDHEYGDALIDEVRARRRALYESFGDDLEKIVDAVRRLEAQHPERMDDRRRPRPSELGSGNVA